MVIGLFSLYPTVFASTGKIANFHLGLAIERDSQDFGVVVSRLIRLSHILKNGIGFRDFLVRL
jgi:hypothetical protein